MRTRILGIGVAAVAALTVTTVSPSPAQACGLQAVVGEICMMAQSTCPVPYIPAAGQSLSIAEYAALYSVIGTVFGGNGSSFNVPDLRGRVPIGVGTGPGQPTYTLGQKGGAVQVTVSNAQMAQHVHALEAVPVEAEATPWNGVVNAPNTNVPGILAQPTSGIYSTAAANTTMSSAPGTLTGSLTGTTSATGEGSAENNEGPYLAITYCIATSGAPPQHP